MHYDFLNFSDILFVFALGLIIGMPLGWIVIRHSAELTTYLRYHLKVKRAFRPLGPLCGFKGQNWYQSAKSPTPEQNATDQAAEPLAVLTPAEQARASTQLDANLTVEAERTQSQPKELAPQVTAHPDVAPNKKEDK